MKKQAKVLVLRENLWQSLLQDLSTFGFLLSTVWFNFNYIGNSKFVNVIILIMFVLYLFQISKMKKFYNNEDAIKYIND